MDSFIIKDGKKLKRGYTSGSCAAAASKAAAIMLLSKERLNKIHLITPSGVELDLNVHEIEMGDGYVSCGIKKDSGDDPDVTNGMMIFAKVEKTEESHVVEIDGGLGIGRVTKPGLDQPVGNAAINSTPRRMICEEMKNVCEEYGYDGGLKATISAPGGEEIAQKTFNPRLGIVGGISILGTTGIIEPMSDDAVVETIRTEISMRKASGRKTILFTPGNYGADYIKGVLELDPSIAVTTSNYIGEALYAAMEYEMEGALFVGHIGKLVKLAAGMFNTHSRYGDGRKEVFAAHAAKCGACTECVKKIMDSAVTEDMLQILEEEGIRRKVMESIVSSMEEQLCRRAGQALKVGLITFSKNFGLLGVTSLANELLDTIRMEYGTDRIHGI